MKKVIFIIAAIGLFASCDKTELETKTSITDISIVNTLGINLSKTQKLDVKILPENAIQNIEFVWSSSEPDIVEVDSEGNVTASAMGESVITVTLKDNPNISAQCNVVVSDDVIEFEDPSILAWLLDYDTNNNGVIEKCEATAVKKLLLAQRKLKSLSGIESFVNLEVLDCSSNELTKLDLSKNKALKELYCSANKIEAIDVSGFKELEVFNCSNNRITAIDVTNNPKLKVFKCSMNNGSMSKDNHGIREIDVTKNPELEILDVYYLHISKIDVKKNPKLKKLNIGHSCYTMEGVFTPIEKVDLSNNPELEELNCVGGNEPGFGLKSLDLSHNPKLIELTTYGNPELGKLDLTQNTELNYLNCSHNGLEELDLAKCKKISSVSCEWNMIKVLDLRQCAKLEYLNCANNLIGELDFSNTRIGYLLAQNNKITKINMGDKTFDTPKSTAVSGSVLNEPYLYMKLNDNLISEIDLSKQKNLNWLEITNNKLTHLDISNCERLGGLHCANNQLIELVVGKIGRVYELRCENNKLTGTLDLSTMDLGKISAEENRLDNIKVLKGLKTNSTYLLNGKTFPCYTKDAKTNWIFN